MPLMIATFAYLNSKRFEPDTMVIDVRTPQEVSMGKIDAEWWANIPLNEFRQAFALSPDDFESKYGVRKPKLDDDIILQCRSGARSQVAQYMLHDKGYSNTKNFRGGYLLFKEQIKAEEMHQNWKQHP